MLSATRATRVIFPAEVSRTYSICLQTAAGYSPSFADFVCDEEIECCKLMMFWRCFDDIITVYVDFLWEALNSSAQWMIQENDFHHSKNTSKSILVSDSFYLNDTLWSRWDIWRYRYLEHPFCLLGFKDLTLPGGIPARSGSGPCHAKRRSLWVS